MARAAARGVQGATRRSPSGPSSGSETLSRIAAAGLGRVTGTGAPACGVVLIQEVGPAPVAHDGGQDVVAHAHAAVLGGEVDHVASPGHGAVM